MVAAMWANPYSQELDCFLRRGEEQQQNLEYQIPEDGAAKKAGLEVETRGLEKNGFDVALDTDDLCINMGLDNGSLKKNRKDQAVQKHEDDGSKCQRSQRKISLKDCKSLLTRKLIGTRWIQKQWEKHCGNPTGIKDSLVSKDFLEQQNGHAHQTHANGKTRRGLPIAYSFISFKTGISTVDCKTHRLSAECIQVWKRWKKSKCLNLQLPIKLGVDSERAEQGNKGLKNVDSKVGNHPRVVVSSKLETAEANNIEEKNDPEVVEAAADSELETICIEVSNIPEEEVCQAGGNKGHGDFPTVGAEQENLHLAREITETESSVENMLRANDDDVQEARSQVDNAASVSDASSSQPFPEQKPEGIFPGIDLSTDGSSMVTARMPRRKACPSSMKTDLTGELTKYLLFRELLRGMSTSEASCSNSGVNAENLSSVSGSEVHVVEDVEAIESRVAETQKTIQEELKPALSPYRVLFEERNKDLLQGLLESLNEEAQLIKQAWSCGDSKVADGNEEQDSNSETQQHSNTSMQSAPSDSKEAKEAKETDKVSLYLSLKDGKVQLKDQDKAKDNQLLQHDCLSNVVKKHGMSTGFYMKITQEELLKKLPSKQKTPRIRNVSVSRRSSSMH